MKDPLAITLLDGSDGPRKHAWGESSMTGHIYRLRPNDPETRIIVEATDPQGRSYTCDSFTDI